MPKPYNTLSDFLKQKFGRKVFKVTIDAGFTCPNRDGKKGYGGCIYCDSATLVPLSHTGEDIKEQLASGIERVRKRHKADKFIAYFQINTNTHAPLDYLKTVYREALCPDVVGIAISTRPDSVSEGVLDLLSELKKERYLWLELGLQSASDETLRKINRGHTAAEFKDAVERIHKRGMDVCAHVIIGLPGEGREEILNTVRFVSGLPVWGIKFHQLQVIKNTPLHEMYERGEVKVLSLEEYAGLVVESLELLPPEMVVHRLSGDTPKQFLAAPGWGANKFIIMERVTELLRLRGACQGSRFEIK